MTAQLPTSRRLSIAARWPPGVVLASWRYLWRTTPLRRCETAGSWDDDHPPPLPAGFDATDVQRPEQGVGPLLHRRYRVRAAGTEMTPEALVARLCADLDAFAPSEFATFCKLTGGDRPLTPGDEYVVRMPGPWDGPVRVVDADDTSFRFATLTGHLEAGQIEFRAVRDGALTFEIESWARSASRLSNVLFTSLPMAKEVQLHMWVSVLERVVEASGGVRQGRIEIDTRRVDEPHGG